MTVTDILYNMTHLQVVQCFLVVQGVHLCPVGADHIVQMLQINNTHIKSFLSSRSWQTRGSFKALRAILSRYSGSTSFTRWTLQESWTLFDAV